MTTRIRDAFRSGPEESGESIEQSLRIKYGKKLMNYESASKVLSRMNRNLPPFTFREAVGILIQKGGLKSLLVYVFFY